MIENDVHNINQEIKAFYLNLYADFHNDEKNIQNFWEDSDIRNLSPTILD